MKQNSNGPTVSRGDYVVGNYGPHEGTLFKVSKTPWLREDGKEMVALEGVLHDGEVALPVQEIDPAEAEVTTEMGYGADAPPEYAAEYRFREGRHSKGGVYTLQPTGNGIEDYCPICGSNAVRWAHTELGDVGGEWCDTCGYERSH